MKTRWMWALMVLVLCGGLACEVRNPITSNRQGARAVADRHAVDAPQVDAPAEAMEVNAAPIKPDVIKPVGINREQLNLRIQDALRQKGNSAPGMRRASPTRSPDLSKIKLPPRAP